MPPKVTYWTGIWDPSREAMSGEVQTLRQSLGPGARVVSFASGQKSSFVSRDGVIKLSARRWVALRSLATVLEPLGDVTHVFGEMNAWHLLRAVGRRPVLFTVAIPGPALPRDLCDKVSAFAAETEALARDLRAAGVPESRIRVIRPGVNLSLYYPPRQRSGSFRLLFASSPATPDHFEPRGIPLLVETARMHPDVEFVLLWRKWGSRSETDAALRDLHPPRNVVVVREDVADMADMYRSVHATVWMGAEGYGKSCPNSVIEGLAYGCPAIVSSSCGIAGVLVQSGAGVAADRSSQAISAAIENLRTRYVDASRAARGAAETYFSMERFLTEYREIYAVVAASRRGDAVGSPQRRIVTTLNPAPIRMTE